MGKKGKLVRRLISQLEEKACLLEEKNRFLEEALRLVREENAYLQLQLKEFQNKIFKKNKNKNDKDHHGEGPGASQAPRKHGAPWGHIGWFRKKIAFGDYFQAIFSG